MLYRRFSMPLVSSLATLSRHANTAKNIRDKAISALRLVVEIVTPVADVTLEREQFAALFFFIRSLF